MRAVATSTEGRTPASSRGGLAEHSALLTRAGFAHGFFGRRGGVSPAPWASLNFAASTGDSLDHVRENRARAGRELGVDGERIYFLSQVHGVHAVELEGTEHRDEVILREGDATLSRVAGLACGVRSADCGALLVGDPRTGWAAAIHAGWKGAARGVVASVASELQARGSRPSDWVVGIGPLIERCCFEVGEDVAAELAASAPGATGLVDRTRPRPHVDLRALLGAQLSALGVDAARVEHVGGCTVCHPERYFSFRREGQVSGRMLSAIVPR